VLTLELALRPAIPENRATDHMPGEKPQSNVINRGRPFVMALAVTVVLIIYGSLYPFRFYACLDPGGDFRNLLSTWKQPSSLGDLLANVVLYLPFGLFAAKALRGLKAPLRLVVSVLAGVALSVSMEFVQIYDVGRVSAMSDVYTNTLGTFLGAIAGTALSIHYRFLRWEELRHRPFAPLLLCCWLAYRLFPYVPVIDAHKYWQAVKPLINEPTPTFVDILPAFASWLGVGTLLESGWGSAVARRSLPVLVGAVFCARIGIVDIALSRAEVVGGLTAAVLWVAWLHAMTSRRQMIATALAAAIVVEALRPFQFLTLAGSFGWIPFRAFIDGANWTATPALMSKFFLYGTLIWSLSLAGLYWVSATATTAVLVFLANYAQTYLPGRSAEITDALLVLMAGALMKTMDGEPRGGCKGCEHRSTSPGEHRWCNWQ
jgi:VanZ family protein